MTDETIYESKEPRSRRGIASYLRRIANRLGRGEPVPADEEQTVTVTPPAESDPEFEVEVERDDEELAVEIEMSWPAEDVAVDTEATASKATFELYTDKQEEWRWRLVHRNGNIIADSGEGYTSRQNARKGLESVKTNAPGAHVIDQSKETADGETDEGGSKATFELYADKQEKWRWRLVHDNGDIIADGGQGYSSKQKAKQGLRSVQINARGAPVEEQE